MPRTAGTQPCGCGRHPLNGPVRGSDLLSHAHPAYGRKSASGRRAETVLRAPKAPQQPGHPPWMTGGNPPTGHGARCVNGAAHPMPIYHVDFRAAKPWAMTGQPILSGRRINGSWTPWATCSSSFLNAALYDRRLSGVQHGLQLRLVQHRHAQLHRFVVLGTGIVAHSHERGLLGHAGGHLRAVGFERIRCLVA